MGNTFGHLFRVTTWGESHGPATEAVIDGCPALLPLSEADIQPDLDRRAPGQSALVTQRKESDTIRIASGVFEGKTLGTPIGLLIPLWRPPPADRHAARSRGHPEDPRAPRLRPLGAESRPRPTRIRRRRALIGSAPRRGGRHRAGAARWHSC